MEPARLHARGKRDRVPGFGIVVVAVVLAINSSGIDATTYKWVDKEGQVHLSDVPPRGVPYEAIETPSRPAPSPPPAPTVPVPPPHTAAEPPRATTARLPAEDAARDSACVDALYQVALLKPTRPAATTSRRESRRSAAPAN